MSARVLEWLDEEARRFALPTFTFEQEVMLGARLHLLGGGQSRAVAVQMLVFWPENDGFQGQLRGISTGEAFHHRWFPLEPSRIEYDDSMDAVGPASFRLASSSDEVRVDWPLHAEAAEEHATMAELEALAAAVAAHRDAMFLDDGTVVERVGLPILITTDAWTHPDISNLESPSAIPDWKRISEILADGEGTFEPRGEPNANDWRHWFALLNG